MWKKTLTIDKAYTRESRALLSELKKNKAAVFALEEHKSRLVVSVAAKNSDGEAVDDFVCGIAAKILTTYFKHAYLTRELGLKKVSEAAAGLLAVMIYYDCEGDFDELFGQFKKSEIICIDGVFNFAMRSIKEDWEELAAISSDLFEGAYCDEDLYEVTGYVVEERADRTKLLIADEKNPVVTDLTSGGFVTVDDFYGDKTLNLINCAVGHGAKEITLDAGFKDERLINALSRFSKVRRI